MGKNIPLRPFQSPPTVIDATNDCLYERQWIPLLPVSDRVEKKKDGVNEFANYKYDRLNVDRNLFDAFYEQGEIMREYQDNPAELNEFAAYWKGEDVLRDKAKQVIAQFDGLKPAPHDICNIMPMSYNLSIQYDQERKKEENKAEQKKRKEKKLEQIKERQGEHKEGEEDEPAQVKKGESPTKDEAPAPQI